MCFIHVLLLVLKSTFAPQRGLWRSGRETLCADSTVITWLVGGVFLDEVKSVYMSFILDVIVWVRQLRWLTKVVLAKV